MSRIQKLIKEKCPNGVVFKKIKDISKVTIGEFVHKNSQSENGKYPVYNGGITNTGYYDKYNNDGKKVIISARGANAGYVNRINEKYWAGNSCYTIAIINESYVDWNYLYHYLKDNEKTLLGIQQTGSIPALSKNQVEEFKIPIPPLEVQEEIARILDKFGKLEAELEAELEARKQQYEYWRGKLLNNDININKLGNIATFSQGIQVDVDKQFEVKSDGMVQFLRIVDFVKNDEIPRYIDKPDDRYMKREDTELIMIRYGASAAGKVFLNKSGAIANNMFKINLTTNEINIKYLWHYLSQTSVYKLLNNTGGSSTMPAINFKMVSLLNIPIPSLKEQQRIVKILDKFDKLVNDISEGLPAEIELRRKQYEYYRHKLFSFEEL